MALNRSPEFRGVIVQLVVEIQSESAWALTNITLANTCHVIFHASEASGSAEENFNIFLCISLVQTQDTLGRIHFGPWGHYLNKQGTMLHITFQAVEPSEEDFYVYFTCKPRIPWWI